MTDRPIELTSRELDRAGRRLSYWLHGPAADAARMTHDHPQTQVSEDV